MKSKLIIISDVALLLSYTASYAQSHISESFQETSHLLC